MNSKRVLMLILIGLAISAVIFGIGINKLDYSQENNSTDIESIEKQLDHLRNIQMDADRVFMEDEKVRDLINGKEYLKTLEIIHNESYVEDFYWVGFQYKRLEDCKGYKMVGGKIYKFGIDLSNKTVLSVEEAENQNPEMREIRDEEFLDGAYTCVHSLALMRSYTGAFQPVWQKWLYCFRVEGFGDIRLEPELSTNAQGWGCFKHQVTIEEIYNKENFWFNELENDPESKKAWCDGDKLPRFECRSDRESITCEVSYPREGSVWEIIKPRNWPSDANFSYWWDVRVKPNQTIMFDVAVKLESIENARNTYETTHDWRVIFTSPPSPEGMSLAEMKEYGIGAIAVPGTKTIVKKVGKNKHSIEISPDYVNKECNYYAHNPIIIVKKRRERDGIIKMKWKQKGMQRLRGENMV